MKLIGAAVVVAVGLSGGVPTPVSEANPRWAGYVVADPGGGGLAFTSVSATWVQPRITCGVERLDSLGIWVGLGGYGTEGLEQVGVGTTCTRGAKAVSSPWYEILPANATTIDRRRVEPGDTIKARVDVGAARTSVLISIANETRHWRFARTVHASPLDLGSAEWIVEAPRGCTRVACGLRLGNFGSVAMTKISVVANGHRGTIRDGRWQSTALYYVPTAWHAARTGSAAGATPERLDTPGASFRIAWRARAVAPKPATPKPQTPLVAGVRLP
jgi:hypothetical protein